MYHVCACEYHTYKWKKDGPGRPSPAANPLIYRLRVSACIRRLGHMPSLPPPFFPDSCPPPPSPPPPPSTPPSFYPSSFPALLRRQRQTSRGHTARILRFTNSRDAIGRRFENQPRYSARVFLAPLLSSRNSSSTSVPEHYRCLRFHWPPCVRARPSLPLGRRSKSICFFRFFFFFEFSFSNVSSRRQARVYIFIIAIEQEEGRSSSLRAPSIGIIAKRISTRRGLQMHF